MTLEAHADKLARWLRVGGYVPHQRRLREYLAEHGVPSTRIAGRIEVAFHLEADGLVAVALLEGGQRVAVADTTRCLVPLPELRAMIALMQPADEGHVTVRLGAAKPRLERAAAARGLSVGALARTAILAYLDARGAP